MTNIPPISQAPDPKEPPKKTWRDMTLGEIGQKVAKIGVALYLGFKTTSEEIAKQKEDEK